jgi:hypothetical protein
MVSSLPPSVTTAAELEKWDETQHPRGGKPENKGRFSEAPGTRERKAEHARLQDLRRKAVAPQGGFTYRVATGRSPTEGLALSIMPQFGERIPINKFSGAHIAAFMENNKELLASDPRCHVGAWKDERNGEVDLDISVVLGRDDHENAVALCWKHNQESYWSIHENKEYRVGARDNPALARMIKANELSTQTRYLLPPNPTPAEIEQFVAAVKSDGDVAKFIKVVNGGGGDLNKDWDETKHPRGQPKNKGQFSKNPNRGQGREGEERSMLPGVRERGQMGGRAAPAAPPVDPNLSAPPVGAERAIGGAARRRAMMAEQDAARAARRQGVQDAARQQIEQGRVQREREARVAEQQRQDSIQRTAWQTVPEVQGGANVPSAETLERLKLLTDGANTTFQDFGSDSRGRKQYAWYGDNGTVLAVNTGRDNNGNQIFDGAYIENGKKVATVTNSSLGGIFANLENKVDPRSPVVRPVPPPASDPSPAPRPSRPAPNAPAAAAPREPRERIFDLVDPKLKTEEKFDEIRRLAKDKKLAKLIGDSVDFDEDISGIGVQFNVNGYGATEEQWKAEANTVLSSATNGKYSDASEFIGSAYHDFHYAGMITEITKSSVSGREIDLHGIVKDQTSGRQVGYFDRTIRSDGEIHHDYLILDDNVQGGGFGAAFYANSERIYTKSGIKKITTYANLSVGGYTWARCGFEAESTDTVIAYKRTAKDNWRRMCGTTPPPELDSIEHMWEIASVKGPNGEEVGNKTLIGQSWSAVKHLNDDNPGFLAGQLYYSLRGV